MHSCVANLPLVGQITFKQSGSLVMATTKSYDFLNRLSSIGSVGPQSASLSSFAYVYNSANQRVRSTLAGGSFWQYEYDKLGQVRAGRRFWADGTPVAGQQFEYTHDDIGNRRTVKAGGDASGANLRTASYAPNSLNQYTTRTVPGALDVMGVALANDSSLKVNTLDPYRKGEYYRKELSVVNTSDPVWQSVHVILSGEAVDRHEFVPKTPEQFGYDTDGNLTSDGRWNYTWDAENRVILMVANTAVGPQQRIEFEYDWQSRRIAKKVWNNTAGTGNPAVDQRFLYDGWNLLATLNSQLSTLNTFLWGLDLSGSLQGAGGVGGLVAVWDSSTINGQPSTHFAAYDGNGNLAALINAANSQVSATYEYGPFAEPLRADGAMALANPFRFSTKFHDDETDLLYYGYRHYNRSTGRWFGRDPAAEKGGLNLYTFAKNNAIGSLDALGKVCLDPCGLAKAFGLAGDDWGGVVCCDGQMYACVWQTRFAFGKAKEIVENCVLFHELSHFPVTAECPVCSLWPTRGRFKPPPVDGNRAECEAWKGSIACYEEALKGNACGGDSLCEKMIELAKAMAADRRDSFCNRAR